jgi:hypothetical protein
LTELQQTMHRALDRLVDEPRETGDWGRVLADAERRTQGAWLARVAVVAVAAVVGVAAALVSPFEDEQPTGVIGRALAAVGDGPVLHVVFRSDLGTAFVRLSTGEVTPVYAEVELWFDPDRGAHYASRRHLVIEQARGFPRAWHPASRGVAIPDGSAFVWANRSAFLRDERRSILIRGKATEDVLAAAFSLRPFGASREQPGTLDVERIAREVERPQIPAVEGFAPVQPRPLVRRRGTRIQFGGAQGATVAIFSGGVATFDTTGMDERIREVVGKTVSANCARVTNGIGGSGVGGEVPSNGVKDVVMLAQPQRGRMPIIKGRFDFCELSTGLGRNWLRRNGWHGLLEIPLTTRGARFLDERAAVRAARAKRN